MKTNGDALRALKDRASLLTATGKLGPALAAWQRVTEASEDDLGAHQKVGELLAKLGRTEQAVAVFEDVATRYARRGLFFKATAVARVLLGIQPGHAATLRLIAGLYARGDAQADEMVPASSPSNPRIALLGPPAVRSQADVTLPVIPFFSSLPLAALEAVLTLATELKAFEPDEALITQGGSSRSMFALVSGRATASRDDGTATRCVLPDFAPGEVFGEAALAEGAPDFATVLAACPTVALQFSREAMAAVIAGHPSVIAALRAVR